MEKLISPVGSSTLASFVPTRQCVCLCFRMHSVCWRIQTPGTAPWASSWTPCKERRSAPLSTVLFWVRNTLREHDRFNRLHNLNVAADKWPCKDPVMWPQVVTVIHTYLIVVMNSLFSLIQSLRICLNSRLSCWLWVRPLSACSWWPGFALGPAPSPESTTFCTSTSTGKGTIDNYRNKLYYYYY